MLVEMADMTKKTPLGVDNTRVSYDMEKKDHNFTTPTENIFMIKSDLENRPQSPACSDNQSRNLHDRSPDDSSHNQDVHRDSTYWWHDHGFKEEERDEMGIEKYDPPKVQVETFKVRKYSFKGGQKFVCVTKEVEDALPLGRRNRSRFKEMTRKEFNINIQDKT
ncbi:hypothetical protein Tco_1426537 [Tanacetum coccineum]